MPRLPKANVRWSSQLCRAMSIASPIMHVKKVRIILGSRLLRVKQNYSKAQTNIRCFRYVPGTRARLLSRWVLLAGVLPTASRGNHMRALIALPLVVLAVSSALANQISNGYVLQVHSDGRVVNVPLGHGRQPLVGISMPNTHILTVGVSICCNYSDAEVFTLIVNHQRFTQTVFIGCSDPECPAAVGFFVPDQLRDHPYEALFRVSLKDGTTREYRFRFVNRQLE